MIGDPAQRRGPTTDWPRLPVIGVATAIAITTTMDAKGLFNFSALPPFPLARLFWRLERLPRQRLGLVWCHWRGYGMALLHPVVVLSMIVAIALAAGASDPSHADWAKAIRRGSTIAAVTIVMAILTEEGFFRGWLWASLIRSGRSEQSVLLWTSAAFALWHVSAVTLHTGFDPPGRQVPVFLLNAVAMGAAWGLTRAISGSIIASSVTHGVWNGIVYTLFAFGSKVGALGVTETWLYGPEVGLLGLGLNVAFVAVLWRWWRARRADVPSPGSGADPPMQAIAPPA